VLQDVNKLIDCLINGIVFYACAKLAERVVPNSTYGLNHSLSCWCLLQLSLKNRETTFGFGCVTSRTVSAKCGSRFNLQIGNTGVAYSSWNK